MPNHSQVISWRVRSKNARKDAAFSQFFQGLSPHTCGVEAHHIKAVAFPDRRQRLPPRPWLPPAWWWRWCSWAVPVGLAPSVAMPTIAAAAFFSTVRVMALSPEISATECMSMMSLVPT